MLFSPNSYSENRWKRLSSPTSADLRNCVFTDSLNGWAAGDSGRIIHTSNGGNTFVIQNSGMDFYINDIFFLNKRLGWVVANEFIFSGTTILTTTNGGLNWSSQLFNDTTKIFRTIYFRDSLNGFLAGFGGFIYKTTNAGTSWFQTVIDPSEFSGFPINKVNFTNANTGFAGGGYIDVAGVIWNTTDGGQSWSAEAYSAEPIYDIFIKDQNSIIAAGGDFEYGPQTCKSSDAGQSWTYELLKLFGQTYSLDFRTPAEGWMALGYSRTWAVSNDSGQSWISIPTNDTSDYYTISFPDSLHGYAFGSGGSILKYDPTISEVQISVSNLPEEYFLKQNYPNPFNPVSNLEFGISESGFVSLKVFDVLGNMVATLVNERKSPGSYEVEFNGRGFASGIYFCTLSINGKIFETKRMVLLK
ncbi:MAG: YCF48-related protein [bacterium]